jgi:hypothetical protein
MPSGFYLGPVGYMQKLPDPEQQLPSNHKRVRGTHQLLNGHSVVDEWLSTTREYQLTWNIMQEAEFQILKALSEGAFGPPPYAFLDPNQDNLLTANQSSGTNVLQDVSDFAVGTIVPSSISSSTAVSYLRPRSLAWAVTAVNCELATGTIQLGAADPNADVPVIFGEYYRAAVRARLAGSTGSLYCTIRWYTAAGVFINDTVSPLTPLSATAWTKVEVIGTPPATAALARVRVINGAFGVATTIYLDDFRLQMLTETDNMILNEDMEDSSGTSVVRTNLFPAPTGIAAGIAAWSAFAGTGGTSTITAQTGQSGWTYGATTAARNTWTVATSAVGGGILMGRTGTTDIAVTPGFTYGGIVQVRCNKIQRLQIRIVFYDGAGANLGQFFSAAQVVPANTVATFVIANALCPAAAVRSQIVIESAAGTSGTNWAVADWLEATIGHFEETDLTLTYSDVGADNARLRAWASGSVTSAGINMPAETIIAWTGTVGNSTSTLSAPTITQWTGAGAFLPAALTIASERTMFGTYSLKMNFPSGTTGNNACRVNSANLTGLTLGKTYAISVWVYAPSGSPDIGLAVFGTQIDTSAVKDQWVLLTGTKAATATTTQVFVYNFVGTAVTINKGDLFYIDGAVFVNGAYLPAFTPPMPYSIGNGVPRVARFDIADQYPWLPYHGPTQIALTEL